MIVRAAVVAVLIVAVTAVAQIGPKDEGLTSNNFGDNSPDGIVALEVPAPAGGPDTTDPEILVAPTPIFLSTGNGDSLYVTITGGTYSEPVYKVLVVDYGTSYPYYGAGDRMYNHKTRSVGVDSVQTNKPSAEPVYLVDHAYHTDPIWVRLQVFDLAGNRSEGVVIYDGKVEVPIGSVPTLAHDEWKVAAYHSGGRWPSSGTVEEWGKSHGIIVPLGHMSGDDWLENGAEAYADSWVKRARASTGANNVVAVEHGGAESVNDPYGRPSGYRKYLFMTSILDSLETAASVEEPWFLVRDTGDSLAYVSTITAEGHEMNLTRQWARERFAQFCANEWNHSDNRLAYTGFLFDGWEPFSTFQIFSEPQDYGDEDIEGYLRFGALEADLDRDGTALYYDTDEQVSLRAARIQFAADLRAIVAATATAGEDAYFLFGGNTDAALLDAPFLASMDVLQVEDLYNGAVTTTGLSTSQYVSIYGLGLNYQNGIDPGWYVQERPKEYYLLFPGTIPTPAQFTAQITELASEMRTASGGPFIFPEMDIVMSSWDDTTPNVDMATLETFSLLADNLYPVWGDTSYIAATTRVWNHPEEEGLASLAGLGAATAPAVMDSVGYLWTFVRPFENGTVRVQMPNRAHAYGDSLEYEVTVDGEEDPLRLSAGFDSTPTAEEYPETYLWVFRSTGAANTTISGTTATITSDGTSARFDNVFDVVGSYAYSTIAAQPDPAVSPSSGSSVYCWDNGGLPIEASDDGRIGLLGFGSLADTLAIIDIEQVLFIVRTGQLTVNTHNATTDTFYFSVVNNTPLSEWDQTAVNEASYSYADVGATTAWSAAISTIDDVLDIGPTFRFRETDTELSRYHTHDLTQQFVNAGPDVSGIAISYVDGSADGTAPYVSHHLNGTPQARPEIWVIGTYSVGGSDFAVSDNTPSEDQTITVTGSGFGAKDPPEPRLMETFDDDGAASGDLFSAHWGAGWHETASGSTLPAFYSDTTSVQMPNSTMNISITPIIEDEHFLMWDAGHTTAANRINFGDKGFCSFYFRSNYHGSGGTELPSQWKMHRPFAYWDGTTSPDGLTYATGSWYPTIGANWGGGGSGYTTIPGRLLYQNYAVGTRVNGGDVRIFNNSEARPTPQPDEWVQIETEIKAQSGLNIADGICRAWYNGIFGSDSEEYDWNQIPYTVDPGSRSYIYSGPVFGRHVGDWTAGGYNPYQTHVDQVYWDDCWARICIADASTWEASKNKVYQVATAWSNTSITISSFFPGQYDVSDSAWIYVINEDGMVSEGIPITIGP